MKIIKRLFVWALISIIMQVSVFWYFDKIKFKYTDDIKIQKVEGYDEEEFKEIDNSILKEAIDIEVSDDGKYICYRQDEKVMIYDVYREEGREILADAQQNILYYSWIVDEDILMVIEKELSQDNIEYIKVSTYNVKNNLEKNITNNLCEYIDGMTISSIQVSIGAGTTYIGIKANEYDSYLYKIDINDNSCRIGYYVSDIGIMQTVEGYDILVYEDALNKQVYYYENGKNDVINTQYIDSIKLIGIDNDKNIYIGEVQNNKINKIVYGPYNSEYSTWKNVDLDVSLNCEDIICTRNNKLYLKSNNKLINIVTNEELEYKGELLQVTSNVICSLYEDKIIIKNYI